MSYALLTDRSGLLGTAAGLLAGLPPAAVYGYLLARLFIPVVLIIHASRGATPAERIGLVRHYLSGHSEIRRSNRR
jgi:hypothetical protein